MLVSINYYTFAPDYESQLYHIVDGLYYLQQKDVVYVEANDTKLRQSTVNGNTIRSTSFWISLASLITSIAVLIVK